MPARTGRRWRALKIRIIARDGGLCHLCGALGSDTADHLVTVKDGGAIYDMSNLRAAHRRCNLIRGARSIEAARADIARLTGASTDWDW